MVSLKIKVKHTFSFTYYPAYMMICQTAYDQTFLDS